MPTKAADTFERVKRVGLTLPDVEATTKYDGSPVLKVRGCFMAGLATHRSAEPQTLVVRVGFEERALAPGGCARDLLRDRLLRKVSARAGASVANRSRRSARLAVRFVAPDGGEG